MKFNDEILNSVSELFSGKNVWLVGGYIRNYLIKSKISFDRDIVVLDGAKDLALKIAEKSNGTFVELDSENEIYRVVLPDKKNYFDVAKALDNDILHDAKRRDFTINSIFYDFSRDEFYDPLNGISDIKNKTLRTFDFQNLKDDPLRFLRYYRFMAALNFKGDDELTNFIKENFHLIKNVAPERITAEIMHIFESPYLVETLLKMFDDGILELVFPFVSKIKKIPPNTHHHLDLVHHSIETVKNIRADKPLLKLAAFYHDIGKPSTWTIEESGRHRFIGHDTKGGELVKEELAALKFSQSQINYISKMVRYHIYPAALANSTDNKKAYARFVRKMGADTEDIIELSRADRLSARGVAVSDEMVDRALNHLDNLLKYYEDVKFIAQNPKPLLDGQEIMQELNIKPSKKVGEIIEELIENQLMGSLKTKDGALKYIQKFKI